jgi:hypothetical protein
MEKFHKQHGYHQTTNSQNSPEQFQERAAKVEQFDLLYTKTIVAVKRMIIQVDPPRLVEKRNLKSPQR